MVSGCLICLKVRAVEDGENVLQPSLLGIARDWRIALRQNLPRDLCVEVRRTPEGVWRWQHIQQCAQHDD